MLSICRREGKTDDAGDMGPNCYRGLESTALSTQTEAEYLRTGAGRLGVHQGEHYQNSVLFVFLVKWEPNLWQRRHSEMRCPKLEEFDQT